MIFDGDRGELGKYMRSIADTVGLRDWTVTVMDESPQHDDESACVHVVYGRKIANVYFDSDWAYNGPEELRQTCVHELLHCHLEPIRRAMNNARDGLGSIGFNILDGSVVDAIEDAVDAIATEWAVSLPLPVKDGDHE